VLDFLHSFPVQFLDRSEWTLFGQANPEVTRAGKWHGTGQQGGESEACEVADSAFQRIRGYVHI
jgi:hypothetical protein